MKKVKPGHTVFEYNSINPFVLELAINQVTGQLHTVTDQDKFCEE